MPRSRPKLPGKTQLTDLQVDGTTVVVDETNNRLGIGTASPASTVEIEGSSGDLILEIDNNASNSANFQIQNGAGNARVALVMNAGRANTTITMKGQIVGIGDTSPSYTLDVGGNAQIVTDLIVGGSVSLRAKADAISDTAAYGQLWVKTATPNQLYFTTDAGDDIQLTSGTATAFVGDITGVTAGDGLTGGGTTGALSIAVGAGTGIDVATDAISVDVSDFMTNGADNYLVTATGTDAMNAEANLQFDGTGLKLKEAANASADTAAYGQLWVKNVTPWELYFTTDAGNDIKLTDGTSASGGGTAVNDMNLILHVQTFGR